MKRHISPRFRASPPTGSGALTKRSSEVPAKSPSPRGKAKGCNFYNHAVLRWTEAGPEGGRYEGWLNGARCWVRKHPADLSAVEFTLEIKSAFRATKVRKFPPYRSKRFGGATDGEDETIIE